MWEFAVNRDRQTLPSKGVKDLEQSQNQPVYLRVCSERVEVILVFHNGISNQAVINNYFKYSNPWHFIPWVTFN